MKWITLGIFALLNLAPATSAGAQEPVLPEPCATVSFEGDGFVACTVDPAKYEVRLFLKDADGHPYGSLATFAAAGPPIVFAMNAGMYLEDLRPQGLYIEAGETTGRLNMPPNTTSTSSPTASSPSASTAMPR